MLVVVIAVGRMQVLPVTEVDVAGMHGRLMSASGTMDVHVATVRQMTRRPWHGPVVDMIAIAMVEVPVVQVVEVVVVRDRHVPAPRVVPVVMGLVGQVRLVRGRPSGVSVHGRSMVAPVSRTC